MGHPTVEVTLLFTDIEGSTALAHELGDEYVEVLAQHNRIIRDAIGHFTGVEARNEGDAFFAAFDDASDAVAAALEAQRALAAHAWPHGRPLRVRMGLHTGSVIRLLHDFAGLNVHLASRISAAAHGGQVVASQAVLEALAPDAAFTWSALGDHIVKDFPEPITLHQLVADGLDTRFPPLTTIDARDHNLPAMVTSFVGRVEELAELRTLLSGEARLVSLTGPGGAGKTRIALEAAWSVLSRYRGGAWFVDFAPVTDPETIVDTIAETLGARDRDDLVVKLDEAPTLLVLDNLEQLLSGVAAVSELLHACPKLEVLATTRERLRLQGEHEVVLDGLSEPEAVDLFVARARLVQRDFAADDHVRQLCRRVGGLPLAIELAAARLRTHTTEQLVGAMDDMLAALSEGERDRPARHRAMRAAIALSVDALTEAERRVFRTFAVFAGGATVDAVGAVCAPKADEIDSLVDKSLVRRRDERLTMLEPIRQFAEERLRTDVPGEFDQRVEGHARYYLELAQRLEPDLVTGRQRDALDELTREHANLRLAWERGAGDTPVRVAACLTRFWTYRGSPHEGRAVLARTLADHPEADAVVRSNALVGLGQLAILQNDVAHARPALEEALAIGDGATVASAYRLLGEAARVEGDAAAADRLFAEALSRAEAIGDHRLAGQVRTGQGAVAFARGDLLEATALWQSAFELSERVRDESAMTRALGNLGLAQRYLGQVADAIETFERSLALARHNGDRAAQAAALQNIAAAMLDQMEEADDPAAEEAAGYVREAVAIYDELGYRRELANALLALAALATDEGTWPIARARALFLELRDHAGIARADAQLAMVRELLDASD